MKEEPRTINLAAAEQRVVDQMLQTVQPEEVMEPIALTPDDNPPQRAMRKDVFGNDDWDIPRDDPEQIEAKARMEQQYRAEQEEHRKRNSYTVEFNFQNELLEGANCKVVYVNGNPTFVAIWNDVEHITVPVWMLARLMSVVLSNANNISPQVAGAAQAGYRQGY